MTFVVDKQTLEDLNVFGKRGRNSIYSLFNRTYTKGGADVLERMFLYPLSDAEKINNRSNIIKYFYDRDTPFPFEAEWFDTIDQYLADNDERSRLRIDQDNVSRKVGSLIGADSQHKQIQQGIVVAAKIFEQLTAFLKELEKESSIALFKESIDVLRPILEDQELLAFSEHLSQHKPSFKDMVEYDNLVRFQSRSKFVQLLEHIYLFDVYIAVATIAKKEGLSFAFAKPRSVISTASMPEPLMVLENLHHPLVPGAIGNDLQIDSSNNIIFLTGANMAGKSTFMKSLGIAVYLSHIGFPVAANRMEFVVRDGLFTTINLADNLNMGYSHFYAEVRRVKQVSEELASGKNLFVIFDELFRGTNVKDAYEATVAITKAYARHSNCMFVVSTHIIEAADELREACSNINFVYLPTIMNGSVPTYTYKLTQGVTEDRHGMVIINNEKIIDVLEAGIKDNRKINHGSVFYTDKQTLDDLNILGKFKSNSIFSIFNKTVTSGGELLLENMFREPFTTHEQIASRNVIFADFIRLELKFPVEREIFSEAENYLRKGSQTSPISIVFQGLRRQALAIIGLREEQEHNLKGILASLKTIKQVYAFLQYLLGEVKLPALKEDIKKHIDLLETHFSDLLKTSFSTAEEISWSQELKSDQAFRGRASAAIVSILDFMQHIDVYIAVGTVSRALGLNIPHVVDKEKNIFEVTDAFHPALKNPVANTVSLDKQENFIFLTGANMAGKSTIMKTIGVNFYLAHIGFPVAAASMQFSPKEGVFSSINVPDNLDMGYSHFYAEVLRVKHVAQEVASKKDLLIIFDELFKGTNVKDAFDATLAVSNSFSSYKNCHFIISTHIVEVGEELAKNQRKVQFRYMPTVMEGHAAKYPYKIATGISDDRHGMMIIKNENILNILEE